MARRESWGTRETGRRVLEEAKREAGGEFVNFRDDSPQQIARTIMANAGPVKAKIMDAIRRRLTLTDRRVTHATLPPRRPEPRCA